MTRNELARRMKQYGHQILRYGLALVLIWIGGMKFTAYEAAGIQPLVASSFLLSWVYSIWSVQTFSALLGGFEILLGLLIVLRPVVRGWSAAAGALAAGMFLVTLSFLFTTPGWEPTAGGFPALSVAPGQFVLKDIVLFGAALWATGDALEA